MPDTKENLTGKTRGDQDSLRGGTRLQGGSKLLIRLREHPSGGSFLRFAKVSYGRKPPDVFLRQDDNGWWFQAESPAETSDRNATAVLEAVADAGSPVSIEQIRRVTNLSDKTVRRHLGDLVRDGLVASEGTTRAKRFRIPVNSGQPAVTGNETLWEQTR